MPFELKRGFSICFQKDMCVFQVTPPLRIRERAGWSIEPPGCEHSFDALIVHDASMKLEMLQEAVEEFHVHLERERWHVFRMYDTLPRLHPLSAQLCTQETWSTSKQ